MQPPTLNAVMECVVNICGGQCHVAVQSAASTQISQRTSVAPPSPLPRGDDLYQTSRLTDWRRSAVLVSAMTSLQRRAAAAPTRQAMTR